jgi:inhibitor of KinA
MDKPNIFPLGEAALTIDFGTRIAVELNDRALSLAAYFAENPFAGLIETVPAYSSLTVFYDVYKIRRGFPEFPTAFDFVRSNIENALLEMNENRQIESRLVKIPVCFETKFALDLAPHGMSRCFQFV